MRAIIVDDEPVMVRFFLRECESFQELNIKGSFNSGDEALEFVKENQIEVAFLDVEMPGMTGLELAVKLREIRSDILIVFISAYDYVWDSNRIGGDYYLVKPYDHEMMELMFERVKLLALRQKKKVYMHMFGTFTITYDGQPVPLKGKSKEILAYIATFRGKEVSNQTIFSTLWEDRPYDHSGMSLYFHALKKLKDALEKNGLSELLISNTRGQMINVDMVDCDFYAWQDENTDVNERFRGDFLTEYSWSEPMLSDMLFL